MCQEEGFNPFVFSEVLIVDSSHSDVILLTNFLRRLNDTAKVTGVNDIGKAVRILRKKELLPDVIYLEAGMVGNGGYEVLGPIKSNLHPARVPVVLTLSSDEGSSVIQRNYRDVVDSFLYKPMLSNWYSGLFCMQGFI